PPRDAGVLDDLRAALRRDPGVGYGPRDPAEPAGPRRLSGPGSPRLSELVAVSTGIRYLLQRVRPGGLSLEDRLDLQLDLDLVADDGAAAVERDVEVDAEVVAVDLSVGREAGAGAAPRIGADAVEL